MKNSKPRQRAAVSRAIFRLTLGSIFARRRGRRADAKRYDEALGRLYKVALNEGWLRDAQKAVETAHAIAGSPGSRPPPPARDRHRKRRVNKKPCSKPKPGGKPCCTACAERQERA